MRSKQPIAVVIPALNERDTIGGVLARVPAWVDRVIVVDNGSSDGTAEIAARAGATVVREPARGYGRACLAGIDACGDADIVVFLDADGSDAPEQTDRLVDPILQGRADMVVGSRRLGHAEPGALTFPQRFGNALACTLIRAIWGVRYTDLGPFRAVRTRTLRRLRMDDRTYGWTVQMQVRAARFGAVAMEVPVDYVRRLSGASKISGTIRGVVMAGFGILGCIGRESVRPRCGRDQPGERLALFAKHPTPGRAKTRLIPALGAKGAAELHSRMVRHALRQIESLKRTRNIGAHIWCAGCQPDAFTTLFDTDMPCRMQPEGDLGHRMLVAFVDMLRASDAAVIIGSDCPSITPGALSDAFEALRNNDLVLGPASDGGYYLIGLRRPVPLLFEGVEWGGPEVLRETQRRAGVLGLTSHLLPVRQDVDEAADLPEWDRVSSLNAQRRREDGPSLSVIIPTLNESANIEQTIRVVRRPGVEVIVADGGSDDGTEHIARRCGATVVHAQPGRGMQLNAGAAAAHAETLLFLHADTLMPRNYAETIHDTLSDDRVVLGAMTLAIDRPGLLFRCVEAAVGFRSRALRLPYGDQAFFMRAAAFHRLGGFAPLPLFEDLELIRRARRLGHIRITKERALTSGRRWATVGVVRMTLLNQLCTLAYLLRVDPRRIATWRDAVSRPARIGESQIQRESVAGQDTDHNRSGRVSAGSEGAAPAD